MQQEVTNIFKQFEGCVLNVKVITQSFPNGDAEVVATADVTLALVALSNSLLIIQSSSQASPCSSHRLCKKYNMLSLELECS